MDREEITVLAAYARFSGEQSGTVYSETETPDKSIIALRRFEKEEDDMIVLYRKVKKFLVGEKIMDESTFLAVCTALHRTGLLYNNGGFNGGAEFPTSRFFELKKLVDFEAASIYH